MVSVSVPEGGVAVPARGENRAPPPAPTSKTNNDCQIKFKLLHLRLVRALAVETHENWLEQHRYLNMDDLREHKKEAMGGARFSP